MSTSDIITGVLLSFLSGTAFLIMFCLSFMIWDDYQDKKKRKKRD